MNYHSNIPLVSIVTSTYKHEKYLRRTIDSVLNQDYPNVEYIVINDGSPDGTEEVLKSYGDRLYWSTQENIGEVPTLNRGIKMAKGSLVGKLSSDDYLYPNYVSEVVKQFLNDPDLIVVYTDFDLVDENDALIMSIKKQDYDAVNAVRDHLCLPGPATLFRKELFDQLGGFHTGFRILFDMDFWWRSSLFGKIGHLPVELSAFRQHGNSQSNAGGMLMASETIQCVERFYSTSPMPKEFRKVKRQAFSNAYYAAGSHCVQSKNIKEAKSYYLKSLFYSPGNYLKPENQAKLAKLIVIMLPPKAAQKILRFAKQLKENR
jgi:glycosyltransferase involved in cell wall biosynthesis